ncbi:MAG: hypothetical protein M1825_005755 [Sarcosagium campestre]|nr:MAG: hypothetical protein M1825_005755 [Sarcosagium campestre]
MKGLLSLLSLTGFSVLVVGDGRHATVDASSATAGGPILKRGMITSRTDTSRLQVRSEVAQSHVDELVRQLRQPSGPQLEDQHQHQQEHNHSLAPPRTFEVIYDRLLHDRDGYSLVPRYFAHSAVVFHGTAQDGDLRVDLSTSLAPDGSPYVVRALDYNNAGEDQAEQRRLRRLRRLRRPPGSAPSSASTSAPASVPASTPATAFQGRRNLLATQSVPPSSSNPTSTLDQDDEQSSQREQQEQHEHGNTEGENENDRQFALAQMWQSPPRTLHGSGSASGSRRSRPGQVRIHSHGRPLPNRHIYRGGTTRLTNAEILHEVVPQAWMMADPLYDPDGPNTCHNLTLNVVVAVLRRGSNSSDYTVPNALSDVLAEGNALETFRLDRTVSIVKYLHYDRIERWSTESSGAFILRSLFDMSDPAGLRLIEEWYVD